MECSGLRQKLLHVQLNLCSIFHCIVNFSRKYYFFLIFTKKTFGFYFKKNKVIRKPDRLPTLYSGSVGLYLLYGDIYTYVYDPYTTIMFWPAATSAKRYIFYVYLYRMFIFLKCHSRLAVNAVPQPCYRTCI